ncbi:MAG: O-antigen ligase family protein [Desulfobulbus sp.]|jgi:O-antigen ligase
MRGYQEWIRRVQFAFLLVLAFALPLSTSVVSVAAVVVILCWLVGGQWRERLTEIAGSPMCRALAVYLAVLLLGLLWTESLSDGWEAIRKQWKLFCLPVFLTSIQPRQRWLCATAFIAGVVAAILFIDLDRLGCFQLLGMERPHICDTLADNHLMLTPMLAFATYLVAHQAVWGGLRRRWRLCLAGLAVLMTINVFLTNGQAGHLAFFVLLALGLFQYFRAHLLRAILIPALVAPMVFACAYLGSPVFQQRCQEVIGDLKVYRTNPETSVGLRLHYWRVCAELIREHPWLGVGTGDFTRAYVEANNRFLPVVPMTNNPHNQYVFITAQLGVLGLAALLGLFAVLLWEAARRRDAWRRIRVAFPVFFLTIMLTESYLNLYTGFLFSLFSAMLVMRDDNALCAASGPEARCA